ncbi:hypothetical protein N9R79_09765 [Vibrio sp.]|nr:hypothetical protein [Vibrio sp.]
MSILRKTLIAFAILFSSTSFSYGLSHFERMNYLLDNYNKESQENMILNIYVYSLQSSLELLNQVNKNQRGKALYCYSGSSPIDVNDSTKKTALLKLILKTYSEEIAFFSRSKINIELPINAFAIYALQKHYPCDNNTIGLGFGSWLRG